MREAAPESSADFNLEGVVGVSRGDCTGNVGRWDVEKIYSRKDKFW